MHLLQSTLLHLLHSQIPASPTLLHLLRSYIPEFIPCPDIAAFYIATCQRSGSPLKPLPSTRTRGTRALLPIKQVDYS